MADDRMKDRDDQVAARPAGKRGTAGNQGTAGQAGTTGATGTGGSGGGATDAADVAGGQHHVATAHGRPAQIDTSLPADRPALIALHAEARRRRAQAALGSDAYRAAADEIGRIEIRIADVDRAESPARG
jgi:hypothetical protein